MMQTCAPPPRPLFYMLIDKDMIERGLLSFLWGWGAKIVISGALKSVGMPDLLLKLAENTKSIIISLMNNLDKSSFFLDLLKA